MYVDVANVISFCCSILFWNLLFSLNKEYYEKAYEGGGGGGRLA